MHRTGRKIGLGSKLAVYVFAGTAAAAIAGAALALAGSLLTVEARTVIASVAALAALFLGSAGLLQFRIPLIQVDRETRYGWLHGSPLSWALRNGAAIGFGAGTRLGVWLWYLIPIGAMVSGNVFIGVVGYGAYGLSRTGGAGLLLMLQSRHRNIPVWLRVLRQSARARRFADAQLLLVGFAVLLVVGL